MTSTNPAKPKDKASLTARTHLISVVLSIPLATALLSIFGGLYLNKYYQELGLPLSVLGFAPSDYARRSWDTGYGMTASIPWIPGLILATGFVVLAKIKRAAVRSVAFLLAAGGLIGFWPPSTIHADLSRLWVWLLAALTLSFTVKSFVSNFLPREVSLIGHWAAVTAAAIKFVVIAANVLGTQLACQVDQKRLKKPEVTLVASSPLAVGKQERTDENIWSHTNLRLLGEVPNGFLVWEKNDSPRNGVTLVRPDSILTVQVEPQRDQGLLSPGKTCEKILDI